MARSVMLLSMTLMAFCSLTSASTLQELYNEPSSRQISGNDPIAERLQGALSYITRKVHPFDDGHKYVSIPQKEKVTLNCSVGDGHIIDATFMYLEPTRGPQCVKVIKENNKYKVPALEFNFHIGVHANPQRPKNANNKGVFAGTYTTEISLVVRVKNGKITASRTIGQTRQYESGSRSYGPVGADYGKLNSKDEARSGGWSRTCTVLPPVNSTHVLVRLAVRNIAGKYKREAMKALSQIERDQQYCT